MSCFYINGQLLSKYCVENGISYTKCYYYLDKYGLSVEEAIKKVKDGVKKNLKWEIDGKSVYSYCKRNRLWYNSVMRGIKEGLGVKEAIEKSKRNFGKKGVPAKYKYNGVSFKSYCDKMGINYQTAHHWLKKGYSVDYIIERSKNV